MAIHPHLEPGELVQYERDGYEFLGLVVSTVPAPRRGMPILIKVDWCGLEPKIFPGNFVAEKHLRKVKNK